MRVGFDLVCFNVLYDRGDRSMIFMGLKVIMESQLWSIVQNSQVKVNRVKLNQVKMSTYIQIIFKSLSCLSKKEGFNSDIIQRLSNFGVLAPYNHI